MYCANKVNDSQCTKSNCDRHLQYMCGYNVYSIIITVHLYVMFQPDISCQIWNIYSAIKLNLNAYIAFPTSIASGDDKAKNKKKLV